MPWYNKYWDSVDQFYWNPSLLGLQSIPKSEWGNDPKFIQVARDRIRNGGSVYARHGTAKENAVRMRGLEEPLNHIFDITFSIAADEIISRLFHGRFGIDDPGPFERLGREIQQRYKWLDSNVTQQDGFIVSPRSTIGVELKLKSRTWRVQTLKYLALMVLEEQRAGPKDHLGLLYITPAEDPEPVWKHCGASPAGVLEPDFLDLCCTSKLNGTLRKLVEAHRPHLADAAARLQLAHVSWTQFVQSCTDLSEALEKTKAGEATLARLLEGFSEAVRAHQGTGAG